MWLSMSTVRGFKWRGFLISSKIDPFKMDTYNFNDIVLRTGFKEILKELSFKNNKPPAYKDPFWEVIQMID